MSKRVSKGPQKPRKGWIYRINPAFMALRCPDKHVYQYPLDKVRKVECQHPGCNMTITKTCRVFAGTHYYIYWGRDDLSTGVVQAIPLTSRETHVGLPTSLFLRASDENGTRLNGYALIHQITPLDERVFKNAHGWLQRDGSLTKGQKRDVERRIEYLFQVGQEHPGAQQIPPADLIMNLFPQVPTADKMDLIDSMMNWMESEEEDEQQVFETTESG